MATSLVHHHWFKSNSHLKSTWPYILFLAIRICHVLDDFSCSIHWNLDSKAVLHLEYPDTARHCQTLPDTLPDLHVPTRTNFNLGVEKLAQHPSEGGYSNVGSPQLQLIRTDIDLCSTAIYVGTVIIAVKRILTQILEKCYRNMSKIVPQLFRNWLEKFKCGWMIEQIILKVTDKVHAVVQRYVCKLYFNCII
jgi:hypothetical protein